MEFITLKTDSLELTFNKENGVLSTIKASETGWKILSRPEIGLSWRILLPLSEERRNNNVFGENQVLSGWELESDRIVFKWDNVISQYGGVHPIEITLTVRAEDRQAVFEIEIDNRTEYIVENVYCPYIADITPPADAMWLKFFSTTYANAMELDIWPHFTNTMGYFGVDHPTLLCNDFSGVPSMPFILLRSEDEGLYMGVKANSCDYLSWIGELLPGWDSSIDMRVPDSLEIAGKPVHKRFAALHVPYILPGDKRALTPVALEAYRGDWQDGADIYTKWRKSWMKPAVAPHWAREPHSWQQLHINSPEDELRLRFVDLPKVAEVCKKHGVKAIQLVGWNDGGQDQGNPSHTPDPRLGTFDELKNAISICHEMGVKVILFTKFIWADRSTNEFRDEYIKYSVKDPYGDYYIRNGYQYQTGTQLLNINTKRLIPMCFGSNEYLKICEREFKKIVDLGAAGMLFDECQHHSPTYVCFDESHGHRYGWPTYTNDRLFIERMWKSTDVPEDFLMVGEDCYDWEMEAYQLTYYRSMSKHFIPLKRYMLPESQFMTAVTGYNDRNMINQCLMHRLIISYEPLNFKGSLDDFPDTVAYGNKMDALRAKYRKWFWDGIFRGTKEIMVFGSNESKYENYGVFRASDNSFGIAISNYEDYPITVKISDDDSCKFKEYRSVDSDEWKIILPDISIPPRSAVIVI